MLLTQLEYFDALARERHFGRAAASCFVTTSTISESVRKLEAEVGVPLVKRGKSSYQELTTEGKLLLLHAREILAAHRRLLDDLSAARGHLEATLRLGVIPSGTAAAAVLVSTLVRRHPGVKVDMSTGLTSEDLITRLRAHQLDAAVVHLPDGLRDDIVLTPLPTVRYVVVLTDTLLDTLHRDCGPQTPVTAADLARLPTALLSVGMQARTCFDDAVRAAGVTVTPTAETDSVESLIALASTGRWAAVVPEEAAEAHGHGLRILPMTRPTVELPAAVARLATTPVSALARAVDEAVAVTGAAE